MLFLHLKIGDDGFALAAERIVEIMPRVALGPAPGGHDHVAGSLDYRGWFLPVVDLCALRVGRPARARMSTRIVIVRPFTQDDAPLGLIAEGVTEMLRLEPGDFRPFAETAFGLVQQLDLEKVLPASLLAALGDLRTVDA